MRTCTLILRHRHKDFREKHRFFFKIILFSKNRLNSCFVLQPPSLPSLPSLQASKPPIPPQPLENELARGAYLKRFGLCRTLVLISGGQLFVLFLGKKWLKKWSTNVGNRLIYGFSKKKTKNPQTTQLPQMTPDHLGWILLRKNGPTPVPQKI